MDIAGILKTIADRSSLLFGGMIAGAVFLIADRYGTLPTTAETWIYPIYWLAVFCAAALGFGLLTAVKDWTRAVFDTKRQERCRTALGLKNFRNMLSVHHDTLVYLKARDAKRFPVAYAWSVLDDMHHLGLLNREPSSAFYTDTTYYNVPSEIWGAMQQLKWPVGEPVPQYPPWEERTRI